jgi:hypothetical protein
MTLVFWLFKCHSCLSSCAVMVPSVDLHFEYSFFNVRPFNQMWPLKNSPPPLDVMTLVIVNHFYHITLATLKCYTSISYLVMSSPTRTRFHENSTICFLVCGLPRLEIKWSTALVLRGLDSFLIYLKFLPVPLLSHPFPLLPKRSRRWLNLWSFLRNPDPILHWQPYKCPSCHFNPSLCVMVPGAILCSGL